MVYYKITDRISIIALWVSIINLIIIIILGYFAHLQGNDLKDLQIDQNNLQESYTGFDKAYNLLELNQEIVRKQAIDCNNATNKSELILNQNLLENATIYLRNLDANLSLYYLKKIDQSIDCSKCYNCGPQITGRMDFIRPIIMSICTLVILIIIIGIIIFLRHTKNKGSNKHYPEVTK
jgi:preprotein translocase subunit SecG